MDPNLDATVDPKREAALADGSGDEPWVHVAAYRDLPAAHRDFRIEPEDPQSTDAVACIRAYFDDLEPLFGERLELDDYPLPDRQELTPPRGVFLVARKDAEGHRTPMGCGALTTLEDGVGYITRMWVHADSRGLGLGRRILEGLEDHARRFGHRAVRLYTHKNLATAQSLYRRYGYREVEPFFEDAPFADLFFEKRLDGG